MNLDTGGIGRKLDKLAETDSLSGVVTVHQRGERLFARAEGLANRSDSIPNRIDTRFQIASGCKIFTAVAICQLVERGALTFEAPLADCLSIEFPRFDGRVTVHHLLTHTSGIPDYFEEVAGADYEDLWKRQPMYRIKTPCDFLPLFQGEKMKSAAGERFGYNNAAYIVLGLVVEEQSRKQFVDYIQDRIFAPAGMADSGYFRSDQLPDRTALAYIEEGADGAWRTNIYSVPIIGGPDGGAYVTAPDMVRFWHALYTGRLLSRSMTETLLHPHVDATGDCRATQYGYGVWMRQGTGGSPIHYVEGWDPGVAFLSASYPENDLVVTVACNAQRSVWRIFDAIGLRGLGE